jgi:hypothetical protein
MKKTRMNETEKLFYKSLFAKIKSGRAVSEKARHAWLELHFSKTY